MARRFAAKGDFVRRLDRPERRRAIPPGDVVDRMGVSKRDVVLDLGAGIGYFSIPLSSKVREVVAVDVEPKMLAVLAKRVARSRRANIAPVLGDILYIPLDDECVDRVLLAFVYHESALPALVLEECARVLVPGGRLTVLEFQKTETPFGPPLEERKTPAHVERRAMKRFRMKVHYSEEVYYQLEFEKI